MILPPQVDHTEPLRDSRGIVYNGGWTRNGATLTLAGQYIPEDTPTGEMAPCVICGEPAPILAAAREQPYAACRMLDAERCVLRTLAKRAAQRQEEAERERAAQESAEREEAALEAAARAEGALEAAARAQKAPGRSRSSSRRKEILDAAQKQVADKTPAGKDGPGKAAGDAP